MDYEQKYKDALEWARKVIQGKVGFVLDEVLEKFPELKESEDERVKEAIIATIHLYYGEPLEDEAKEMIAWLEKQGEQKLTDKVKPKFKVGDWITDGYLYNKITDVLEDRYIVDTKFAKRSSIPFKFENYYHLWTIQDAKEGDVLAYVTDEEDLWIMIYWSLYEPYEGHVPYHALLVNDKFSDKGTCCISINDLKPATKEQRDLLFQKMHEAGYEWDEEKKEPKKIEKKSAEWSEKDEERIEQICDDLKCGFENFRSGKNVKGLHFEEIIKSNIDWLKSLKDSKDRVQPKQEWSEEDEAKLKSACALIRNTSLNGNEDVEDFTIDWLKSLKGRVQPKHEWSKEDIYTIENIDSVLFYDKDLPEDTCVRLRNWLKSLKDRYSWKPSDEQLEALKNAIQIKPFENPSDSILWGLYEQLKKL